tara:strand:- start:2904 stop:3410 length:507 start_codon:yes stop_codon:yes gene_type:complete
MKILTLENEALDLNNLPDEIEDDIRFSVLDNSDPKDPDFFYIPLVFLESFSSPAIVLEIDGIEVTVPLDWSIAVGDPECVNDLEVLSLTSLNDRGFSVFLFNSLTGKMPEFSPVKVVNFYNDVKWYFPKAKNNQLLALPIEDGENPRCIYIIKDISRQSEQIDHGLLM